MKILLTGGGTAGSVSPLLAIAGQLKRDKGEKGVVFLWLGTKGGPEEKMVREYGIRFKPIFWGKMRRYFDLRNLLDIFKIKLAFWQSLFIILKFKPDIILSAGSFVSVPVIWAGWVLGKKSLIHQQDVKPGLANKLAAPFASKITVTFEESLKHFPRKKTVWTGNPVREEILGGDKERAIKRFGLERGVPTILVTCGGTGSLVVNEVVVEALPELTEFCQVVHITGGKSKIQNPRPTSPVCQALRRAMAGRPASELAGGRAKSKINSNDKIQKRYCPVEFLDGEGMADAYAAADLVVSRCGMSSLTELSALGKPVIFIPLADTHQEDNARYILRKKAGIVIWQRELTVDPVKSPQNAGQFNRVDKLIGLCKDVISNDKRRGVLSRNIKDVILRGGAGKIAVIIGNLLS